MRIKYEIKILAQLPTWKRINPIPCRWTIIDFGLTISSTSRRVSTKV